MDQSSRQRRAPNSTAAQAKSYAVFRLSYARETFTRTEDNRPRLWQDGAPRAPLVRGPVFAAQKERMIALVRSPHAERSLFAISFAESSVFPLPPDLMLGPMAAAEPSKWARYALNCTIASILGGLAGYAIGYFLWESLGQAIIGLFGYGEKETALRAFYDKWGAWFIFLKGLTPVPFKLVTIVSGAMHFSLPMFIFAATVTRGARFFAVAYLFKRFGPQIAPIMEKRMGLVLVGVAIAIVAALYIAHALI
jgi:membrane protein YqaA with SNARE-associated domain